MRRHLVPPHVIAAAGLSPTAAAVFVCSRRARPVRAVRFKKAGTILTNKF
ncbi:hypothetical protein OCO_20970 [Mycobacterium intracellulare MOTT-02]|nr:hypothetical protein OCO_20970 [Mycobacterium intracellulare MOTT-02]